VDALFVLVHSLLLGPASWAPVAERLMASGAAVVVPSLVRVADADPPYWPAAVELVRRDVPAGRPVVIVAHSNAGLLVPVLAAAHPAAACVFVDAALPERTGASPTGTPERVAFLRERAADGRAPQWTQWWAGEDLPALFPDPVTRAAVTA
jgi:pimeloyl-ACP methyl ester carboxylesterase